MRNVLRLAAVMTVFLGVFALPAFAKQQQTPAMVIRTIEGVVTKVSDGDTIQITDPQGTRVKVRLYGMDAPETPKRGKINKPGQAFGEESHQALKSKIDRQRVKLDVMNVDQYGRTVGIVWLGNRNINREMVADGWAFSYRQYLDRAHASEYINAEEQARKDRKGLWVQGNPDPPWNFRRTLKKKSKSHDDEW